MTDKEKLEKLKKLADAMYYAAQHLTTDASRIHKAMDEYHQFIINEYHKEEQTIPDIVDEHFYEMLGEEPVTKQSVEEAMKEVEEKSKAFTDAHKGESAEEILAQMKGEEPILEVFAKYLDHVSREEAMKTKGAIDRWFKEYFPEPVSEDLEKAAKECAFNLQLQEYFKKGAQWKEKQMKEKCSKLIQISFNNGVETGRNEMKRDAKEAHVIMTHVTKDSVVPSLSAVTLDDSYKEGDKVKVLILKE